MINRTKSVRVRVLQVFNMVVEVGKMERKDSINFSRDLL